MHIHNKTFMIERISSCCDSLLIDDIVYVLMLSTTLVFFYDRCVFKGQVQKQNIIIYGISKHHICMFNYINVVKFSEADCLQ